MGRADDETFVQPPGAGPPGRRLPWQWAAALAVLALGVLALGYALASGGAEGGAGAGAAIPLARVKVPDVVGLERDEAERRLAEADLDAKVTGGEGRVVGQTPGAGEEVPKGSLVALAVEAGHEETTTERATTEQATTGTTPTTTARITTAPATKPKPKPELVTVPSVVGLEQGSAAGEVEGAGLSAAVGYEPTQNPDEDGIVLSQSPGGGASLRRGSTVSLVVGRYEAASGGTTTGTTTSAATGATAP